MSLKRIKTFSEIYLLVENGQVVKKGDILGYMYVPTLEEMVGTMQGSSHIAFSIMEKRGTSKEQEMAPQFLLKKSLNSFRIYIEIQKKVGRVQVMVTTGERVGLPSSMGWYIGPEEHPFGGEYLDVVFYGDERRREWIQNKK